MLSNLPKVTQPVGDRLHFSSDLKLAWRGPGPSLVSPPGDLRGKQQALPLPVRAFSSS